MVRLITSLMAGGASGRRVKQTLVPLNKNPQQWLWIFVVKDESLSY